MKPHHVHTLRKEVRRAIKRACIIGMRNDVRFRDLLQDRAHLAAVVRDRAVADRLLLQIDETDCDGYRINAFAVIPASVMAFERFRDERRNEAEGPCFVWIEEGAAVPRDVWEEAYDAKLPGLSSFDYDLFTQA